MNVLGMDIGAGAIKYGVFSGTLQPLFSACEYAVKGIRP